MKKLLIVLGVLAGLFLVTCVGLPVVMALMGVKGTPKPGQAEFEAANRVIGRHDGENAFGNSTLAKTTAEGFSTLLATARAVMFTGADEKPGAMSLTDGEFLTYCRLNADSAVFLVHVPELRRFEGDAKRSLGELAWLTAQEAVRDAGVSDDDDGLVVALRGSAVYGPILIGKVGDEPPAASEGTRDVLYAYFADAGTAPVEAEATAPVAPDAAPLPAETPVEAAR